MIIVEKEEKKVEQKQEVDLSKTSPSKSYETSHYNNARDRENQKPPRLRKQQDQQKHRDEPTRDGHYQTNRDDKQQTAGKYYTDGYKQNNKHNDNYAGQRRNDKGSAKSDYERREMDRSGQNEYQKRRQNGDYNRGGQQNENKTNDYQRRHNDYDRGGRNDYDRGGRNDYDRQPTGKDYDRGGRTNDYHRGNQYSSNTERNRGSQNVGDSRRDYGNNNAYDERRDQRGERLSVDLFFLHSIIVITYTFNKLFCSIQNRLCLDFGGSLQNPAHRDNTSHLGPRYNKSTQQQQRHQNYHQQQHEPPRQQNYRQGGGASVKDAELDYQHETSQPAEFTTAAPPDGETLGNGAGNQGGGDLSGRFNNMGVQDTRVEDDNPPGTEKHKSYVFTNSSRQVR